MTPWPVIRVREGLRWLFRGQNFVPLERDIDRLAAPLSHHELPERAAKKARKRIRFALSCLPSDRAEKFHDMMDRVGHSVRA